MCLCVRSDGDWQWRRTDGGVLIWRGAPQVKFCQADFRQAPRSPRQEGQQTPHKGGWREWGGELNQPTNHISLCSLRFLLSYTIKWLYLWPKPTYSPILWFMSYRLGFGVVQSPIPFLLSTIPLCFLSRSPLKTWSQCWWAVIKNAKHFSYIKWTIIK